MTARDFCYWLQGYFELGTSLSGITPVQMEQIRNHLALVFKHEIDPSFGNNQEGLNTIHNAGGKPNSSGLIARC